MIQHRSRQCGRGAEMAAILGSILAPIGMGSILGGFMHRSIYDVCDVLDDIDFASIERRIKGHKYLTNYRRRSPRTAQIGTWRYEHRRKWTPEWGWQWVKVTRPPYNGRVYPRNVMEYAKNSILRVAATDSKARRLCGTPSLHHPTGRR